MKHLTGSWFKQRLFIGAIVVSMLVTSCSSVLNSKKISGLTVNYCEPTVKYDYSKIERPENDVPARDSILTAHLSRHDVLVSKAIGIDAYLEEYFQLRTDTLKRLVLKQKITNRLLLTSIEIDALAAELDCNGERINQLANYIDKINDKRTKRITAASVAIAALTTIATVLIKNDNTTAWVGVSGGLLSIGLGALTISPQGKKVTLAFHRNLLKNIWDNDNTNQAYPRAVWSILNEKYFSNFGGQSLRESIKSRWIQYSFDTKADTGSENLFFDKGGVYTADDLHLRADMMNELQATVRSIQQNIRSLAITLNSF